MSQSHQLEDLINAVYGPDGELVSLMIRGQAVSVRRGDLFAFVDGTKLCRLMGKQAFKFTEQATKASTKVGAAVRAHIRILSRKYDTPLGVKTSESKKGLLEVILNEFLASFFGG
jgi:hypothetical protein